jgi:hypothetical protein
MATQRKSQPQMNLSDLNKMLGEATPEERAEFAKNIPLDVQRKMSRDDMRQKARREAQAKATNDMAQMVVAQHGSAIHPPGFEPKPPEWISEMGEEAVQTWLDSWYAGKAPRTMEQFRREHGAANADIATGIVDSVEAATDNPEAVLSVEGGGDEHSYLSMAAGSEEKGL